MARTSSGARGSTKQHVGARRTIFLGAHESLVEAVHARGVRARDDEEIAARPRGDRLRDLGGHQVRRNDVLDPDVMMGALGQDLVLDLDGAEARGLGHAHGAMHVHGVAPAASAVENERKRTDGADIDPELHHFGQREIGLGDALDVSERSAAEIERTKSRGLRELGADRIEHQRGHDGPGGDELGKRVHGV
jgi:hypothetical protein